jgi:hypothetical protein
MTRVHQVSIYMTEVYRVRILRDQDLQGQLYVSRKYRINVLRDQLITLIRPIFQHVCQQTLSWLRFKREANRREMTDDIDRIKCSLIYLNGKKSCSLSEYKDLGLCFFAWRKDVLWIPNREFVPRLFFFLSLASVYLLTVGVESYCCIWSHSVGLLWRSDQLVAKTSTWRHTSDSYPCPRRDPNPHSQQENGNRPTPQTPQPLFIGFVSLRLSEHFHCCVSKPCSSRTHKELLQHGHCYADAPRWQQNMCEGPACLPWE